MQPAIRVENLSKRYRLGATRVDNNLTENLKAGLGRVWRGLTGRAKSAAPESNEFWALKDVSFEVKPGEVVGIIGRNGAGKSTLLKVLSRIVEPTGGRATVRGRMGSLLEVGTGFHPELTGRENIYLNGSILGMSQKEIARKFDEIVAFSGVEQFLDTPVKRYSSGMYVRLAFAVAAHLEPEILIVDEVLAVGDAEFQKKCVEKMRSVSRSGHTVLLVSHNLTQIEGLCKRALSLEQGKMIGFGPAREQVRQYLVQVRQASGPVIDLREHRRRPGLTPILTGLTLKTNGEPGAITRMDCGFGLELSYRVARKPRDLRIGVCLENEYGVKVATFSPTYQAPHLLDDPPTEGVVTADIPTHHLLAGVYYLNLYAEAEGVWDAIEPAGSLEVTAADVFGSGRVPGSREAVTYLACRWSKSW